MDASAAGEFDADHRLVAPLADLFGQRFVRLITNIHLAVAGQAKQGDVVERHSIVKLVNVAADHFVKWDEHPLSCRDVFLHGDPLLQNRGSRNRNASEMERFERKGNGCAGSKTSGVSAGEISVSK